MSVQSSQPSPTLSAAPGEELLRVATGYMASACLQAAAQLRIADLIGEGSRQVAELARDAKANEDALYRILRALVPFGVFIETEPRVFANTPASEQMRTGTFGSLRDMVIWLSDSFHYHAYGELIHAVKTGQNVMAKLVGMEAFEYFEKDRAEGEVFNAAMTSFSGMTTAVVLDAYDFRGLGTVADIGGGHGFFLTSILEADSNLRGILFDLPHVVAGAKFLIESRSLGARCEVVGGDLFQSVPAANSYTLKHIIHDWEDARAVQILKNCARSMKGNGRVILVEMIVPRGNEPHFAKLIDIEMLALVSGRERTESDFAELFAQAGLRLSRIVPTKSPVCVIEALKA